MILLKKAGKIFNNIKLLSISCLPNGSIDYLEVYNSNDQIEKFLLKIENYYKIPSENLRNYLSIHPQADAKEWAYFILKFK